MYSFTDSHKDNRVRHCSECNCYVCSNCNCAVFHLDYQLAHWDDVELGLSVESRMHQQKLKRKREERRKGRETNLISLRKRRLIQSSGNGLRRSLVYIMRIMICWKFQGY